MNKLLYFLEKHRWGVMATFLLHLGVLLYLQVDTYSYNLPERTYEVYAEVAEEEEFIELTPEQIENMQVSQNFDPAQPMKNIVGNVNDKRERSMDNFSRSSTDQKVEASVKDLEKQFFEEFARKNGGSGTKPSDGNKTETSNSSSSTKSNSSESSNSSETSNKQYGGNTMVSYDLSNRTPHNGNDWYIRNPGYTCGSGSNGLVVIAIRVNQNGDVIQAKYDASRSSGANSCMIEQAEIYAKKSRFAFSGSAPKTQDGFIFYNFVSR